MLADEPAAPGIILVVAALSLIHCQTFGGNDDERMHCVWQLRGLTCIASVYAKQIVAIRTCPLTATIEFKS